MLDIHNTQRFFVFHPQVQLVKGTAGAAAYDLFNRKLYWFRDPAIADAMILLSQQHSIADAAESSNLEQVVLENYLRVLADLDIGMVVAQRTAVESYHPLVLKSQSEEYQIYRGGGTVTVELTGRCVYDCGWCTARTVLTPEACTCGVWNDQGEPLSIETLICAIEQLNIIGVERLVVRGGEPLLEPGRLSSLVRAATKLGMHCEIHTTGTIIEEKMIARMQRLPIHFVLLVAAKDAAEFDAAVGRCGSWAKLRQGINVLSSYGISFSAKVPVSLESPPDLSAMKSWLKELGASKIEYLPFMSGAGCTSADLKAAIGPTGPADMAVNLPRFIANGQCHACLDHSYFIAADGRMTPCIAERSATVDLSSTDISVILREEMLSSDLDLPRWKVSECKGCEFRLGCKSCAVRTRQIRGTSQSRHWNCGYSPETATWG